MARRVMYEITFEVPDGTTDEEILSLLSFASVQINDPDESVEFKVGERAGDVGRRG